MTRYLIATSSVHVTAAAADYLADRIGPADEVFVVGVREPDAEARDVGDAANVARARLAVATPTIDVRESDPIGELRAAIAEHDPDVVVVGANAGTASASGLGSTARTLLTDPDRPVVVVPLPALE